MICICQNGKGHLMLLRRNTISQGGYFFITFLRFYFGYFNDMVSLVTI
ncbi:hypothetical protein MtrunA17_Chr6g0449681 [Medicago truncatula]|uniref:Transmembrane protein n=1 Tax=Medicago truncatula TaxID=3880 RepID=A0A396H910_MEDTR|nr:hypothetical protein MtrunA17_Chr6g0449681 [Medicago truncatula]